jgi:hypothetical protein
MSFTITKGPNGISIGATGDTHKDVFAQIADLEEVFGIQKCGKCQCPDFRFIVRTVDDNDYYEFHCKNPKCKAKLAFGQNKKGGGLFPKRKDKDDKWLPDGGWLRWDKEKNIEY